MVSSQGVAFSPVSSPLPTQTSHLGVGSRFANRKTFRARMLGKYPCPGAYRLGLSDDSSKWCREEFRGVVRRRTIPQQVADDCAWRVEAVPSGAPWSFPSVCASRKRLPSIPGGPFGPEAPFRPTSACGVTAHSSSVWSLIVPRERNRSPTWSGRQSEGPGLESQLGPLLQVYRFAMLRQPF